MSKRIMNQKSNSVQVGTELLGRWKLCLSSSQREFSGAVGLFGRCSHSWLCFGTLDIWIFSIQSTHFKLCPCSTSVMSPAPSEMRLELMLRCTMNTSWGSPGLCSEWFQISTSGHCRVRKENGSQLVDDLGCSCCWSHFVSTRVCEALSTASNFWDVRGNGSKPSKWLPSRKRIRFISKESMRLKRNLCFVSVKTSLATVRTGCILLLVR